MSLLSEFSVIWSKPGVSEISAALLGAAFGALASGWASWLLQRKQFKEERRVRSEERTARERAYLMEALYKCLQAASDQLKFAESVAEAEKRLPTMQAPPISGVDKKWAALIPHATLPRPISIEAEALGPLVEEKEAELLMGILDLQAGHDAQLKRWNSFAEAKRNLAAQTSVRVDGSQTFTVLDGTMLQKLYPQMKELSDLADGIFESTAEMAAEAKDTTAKLAAFIERAYGLRTDLVWPDDKSRASASQAS